MILDISMKNYAVLRQSLQCDILHKHGVYIGKSKRDHKVLVVFQLCGFYVEVEYKKYRHRIENIVCSNSVKIAEPYLKFVNVEELVNVPN